MWVKPETRDWVKSCQTTGFNNRRCSTVAAKHTHTHTPTDTHKCTHKRPHTHTNKNGIFSISTRVIHHSQKQTTVSLSQQQPTSIHNSHKRIRNGSETVFLICTHSALFPRPNANLAFSTVSTLHKHSNQKRLPEKNFHNHTHV